MNNTKNIQTTVNYDTYELRCFDEIMEYFHNEDRNSIEVDIWMARKIIELMNDLKRDDNLKDIITNAIIVLNALSQNIPSDTFTSIWDDQINLTKEERNDLNISLKKELLIF
ncbi:MAG: hypothetical protein JW891_10955 [Candidatus Lokiarchaeota archaeon]|nr:hypothetical protein [Candidatus Lokiarchaeota archaeon]